jgi:Putative  PD-(D/E)XK family member, (DUF4420)
MEADFVTASVDERSMRWDLLEFQSPIGERFIARLAVPSRCVDVFIAVDAARRRFVLVRIPEGEPRSITERTSRGIAVQIVEMKVDDSGKNEVFVEIACLELTGYAALDIVTLELVDALIAGASIGRVRLVQSVLAKWRRFWSGVSQNLLTREQQLGLFGELWFLLRWLLPAIGVEQSVAMWRGPIGARNDFEQSGWAVEVKTSGRLDGTHRIHGLEQLLEPPGVELFLFSLAVRDEASGAESLPKLLAELRAALGKDPLIFAKFDAILSAADYDESHAEEYEKLKLRVRGQGLYRVVSGFPRLVPSAIPSGVPLGVGSVDYDLRLDTAGPWLLAETPAAGATLLRSFRGV